MTPSVSVVIPAYNASSFIGRALASLSRQTCRDFEVLVVDDGSTDDTEQTARRGLAEAGLRGECIRQPNKKIAAARNTGIRASRGRIIAFLDHDDIWYPDKVESILKAFSADVNVGVVHHRCKFVNPLGHPLRLSRPCPARPDMLGVLLFTGNLVCTSAAAVRRDLIEQEGCFREELRLDTVEDYDLWIRLSRITQFRYLPRVLGEITVGHASASSRVEYHHAHEDELLREHYRRLEPASCLTRWLMRRRLGSVQRRAARALIASGAFDAARPYVARMLGFFPLDPKSLAVALLWTLRWRGHR